MRKSTTDIAAGLTSLGMAAAFECQTGDLTGVSLYFPRILIIFLVLSGLLVLVQGLLKRKKDPPPCDEAVSIKRVALIAAGSIIYTLLIPLLGFYPTSVLFLYVMAVILHQDEFGQKSTMLSALFFTIILTLVVWAGFSLLLGVPTPEGLIFSSGA